jgi:hypothetical protein
MEKKTPTAHATPIQAYTFLGRSGYSAGNTPAPRDQEISSASNSQLKSSLTSKPNSVKRRIRPRTLKLFSSRAMLHPYVILMVEHRLLPNQFR